MNRLNTTESTGICPRCFSRRTENCCWGSNRADISPAAVTAGVQTLSIGEEEPKMHQARKINVKKLKLAGEVIVFVLGAAAIALIMASGAASSLFSGLV
jgi:hypothetical protein